jgi:hypothetical protein
MLYVGQRVRLSKSGLLATDRPLRGVSGVIVKVSGRIRQNIDVLFDGDRTPTKLLAMFIEPVSAQSPMSGGDAADNVSR